MARVLVVRVPVLPLVRRHDLEPVVNQCVQPEDPEFSFWSFWPLHACGGSTS